MLSPLQYANLDIFTTKFLPLLSRMAKGLIQACVEFDPTTSPFRLCKAELDCCEHTRQMISQIYNHVSFLSQTSSDLVKEWMAEKEVEVEMAKALEFEKLMLQLQAIGSSEEQQYISQQELQKKEFLFHSFQVWRHSSLLSMWMSETCYSSIIVKKLDLDEVGHLGGMNSLEQQNFHNEIAEWKTSPNS